MTGPLKKLNYLQSPFPTLHFIGRYVFNSALSNVGREEGPLENVAFYFLACLARVDKEAHNIYYLLYSIFTELSNKFRTREVDVKISRTFHWLGLQRGKIRHSIDAI